MTTLEKCEAIVLQVTPYSRTSHLVTWLAADYGRFLTLVKGASRPRSVFLGQYDLFYTCELLFYARSREGLFIAKECTPIVTREPLRTDWRATCVAAYMTTLAAEFATTGLQTRLYALLGSCLDVLCRGRAAPELLFWFELKLAQVLGFSPNFSSCVSCHASVAGGTSTAFSPAQGGILCKKCVVRSSDAFPVMPDVLSVLRRWSESGSPRVATGTICSSQQLLAMEKLLGVFYEYHVGDAPKGRRTVLGLLRPCHAEERRG